jgi:hypothetical protein
MERRNDEAAREIAALTSAKPRIEDVARSVIAGLTPREPGELISLSLEDQLDRAYRSVREVCATMGLAADPSDDRAGSRMSVERYGRRFELLSLVEASMRGMRVSIAEHRQLMLSLLVAFDELDEIIDLIERNERLQREQRGGRA